MKKCCFTGHRPGSFVFGTNEKHDTCIEIKQLLEKAIWLAINDGYDYFVSRMAQGVDMWAAEIVLEIRNSKVTKNLIQLECFIPGKFQDRYWSKEAKQRYSNIIQDCDVVQWYSTQPCKPHILLSSDEIMVDKVDRVIAVYDGNGKGGTAHTFSYAYMQKKEIYHIDPVNMTAEFVKY